MYLISHIFLMKLSHNDVLGEVEEEDDIDEYSNDDHDDIDAYNDGDDDVIDYKYSNADDDDIDEYDDDYCIVCMW